MKTFLKILIQVVLLPVSFYLFDKVFINFSSDILSFTNAMFAALAAISALCFTAGSALREDKEIKGQYLHAGVLFFRASMLAIVASVINFSTLEYQEGLSILLKIHPAFVFAIGGACGGFAGMAVYQGHRAIWKLTDTLYESQVT